MENEESAGCKNNTPEGTAVHYFKENPTLPVRVLVSTVTHLVPGDGYNDRTHFIGNLVSQYHWNHDFKWGCDRFESYHAQFAYDNRVCYFLIDHGQFPDGNDDIIPILWYRWTGETLIPIHEALPSRIRKRIKKIPFTRPQPVPGTKSRQKNEIERRGGIWAKLRCDMKIPYEDFEFLEEHPNHAIWLERNIEPRLWLKLKSLEAKMQEFEMEEFEMQRFRQGLILPMGPRPKDCTEMWDCECSFCSL